MSSYTCISVFICVRGRAGEMTERREWVGDSMCVCVCVCFQRGGQIALQVIAVLAGGDFNIQGAERVVRDAVSHRGHMRVAFLSQKRQ